MSRQHYPSQRQQRQADVSVDYAQDGDTLFEGDPPDDEVWPPRTHTSAVRYHTTADGLPPGMTPTRAGPRKTTEIPARRSALPPAGRTTGRGPQPRPTRVISPERKEGAHTRLRWHWLVFVGLAMFIMILGWVAFSALGNWWQITLDDWHYGRPRTFQTDAVVGHHDSADHPSHFLAINLDRHVLIIELPGGDPSKAKIYTGPVLIGPGQDLAPVTLSFQDVNGDGKPDMIVTIENSHVVFINDSGGFRPARPGEAS